MNNQIKRPNPKFTLEFKQDAVKLTTEKGYTHQQVADSLGISLSAVGRWSRAERGSSISSSAKTATLNLAGRAGLLRPRKGNGQLRMGREIIKKAAAFPSASPGQALPRKSDKARGYPGATEDPPNYRVMPRDGGEPVPFMPGLKRQRIAGKPNEKQRGAKARQLFDGHRHT